MPPKKNSDEKKAKDKKTIPKAKDLSKPTKKKPALKTPPAKPFGDSNNTRNSPLSLRGRTVLPKEAKELVNKNVEDSKDKKKAQSKIKKSQSKIKKLQSKKSRSSPKKERQEKSKKINVELANEVANYQLAKSLPIIEIAIPSLSAPEMGKKQPNEICNFTGKGIITIGRNKLTKQAPSLEKVKETPKASAIAPKRSGKGKRSYCHCTPSDATCSPSEITQSINTTVSKKVRKKKKIIDSSNSDHQVVPVKKKRVAKKITASDGKSANAKKINVKNDTKKINLAKVGSDLEVNILEDTANVIRSPSILPADLSLGIGNSNSSPVNKNQNETVKKPVQMRKLNSSKKYQNGVIKNNVTSTIVAREPAFLDALDSLSWTKQISSSDTSCTSVCSSHFVSRDEQLLKLGQKCPGFVKVDKISEISSIISSPTHSQHNTAKLPLNVNKTVTSSCSSNTRADLQDQGSYGDDLKKVNSLLSRYINSYDMEVMDWLGTDHGDNKSIRDNVFYNCFNVESKAFNILKNIENNIWTRKDTNESKDVETDVGKMSLYSYNEIHSPVGNGDIQEDDKEISALNHDYVDKHNNTGEDDEDALSLFAESLVSSRRNSLTSKTHEFEEYIAQPIANVSNFQKVTYIPTKIVNNINDQIKTNNVCEIHNADSTSVREMDIYEKTPTVSDKVESLNNIMSPPMKISNYIPSNKPLQGIYSKVYKGVCFYNLISNCKRFNCMYPHENLEVVDVKNNMSCLPNDMFAQEYTLTKSYPPLRQKFIVAFIEECIKRKSTKLLIEMCVDYLRGFKATSEPNSRKTYVLEITMLHLNEVPLSDYAHLLKNEILEQTTLCEVFMGAIASAQNFQQFKQLFVNLVDYMLNVNREIDLEVAMLIVERICILPCEGALINAFFKVIINTHVEIINCPFVGRLEKRLQSESVKLYEHFQCIKETITISLHKQSSARTSVSSEEKHSRTSPDTTNLDNSVKTPPTIWTHKNMAAEDNLKSYTIFQTPQRVYNTWSPQNSFVDQFNRPQHEFAVPQHYRSRTRRPGPRSHGARRRFKGGGRPHYRRHFQPPASYIRGSYTNGRVAQKTFNNPWKNRKGEQYNQNNHYHS